MTRPLNKEISLPSEVLTIIEDLHGRGFLGYIVGGAVRDLLLGKKVSDWDLATDALPNQLATFFPRVVPTGIHHGTVTILRGIAQYEITTFRTDGDYGSQHRLDPSCLTRNIEEDLRHRDFTINAMAYDPLKGALIDPFGGRRDLRRGVVRGTESPLDRFLEDGLRPYRAVRFAVTLKYRIDEVTFRAIPPALEKVRRVSWERVRDELLKMLSAEKPSDAVEMMKETGLLNVCLPELLEGVGKKQDRPTDLYQHLVATVDMAPCRPVLRLACLLHDIGKARMQNPPGTPSAFAGHEKLGVAIANRIMERLKLSNQQRKYVSRLIENHMLPLPKASNGPALRRFLSSVDRMLVDDLLLLCIANRKAYGVAPAEIRKLEDLRTRIKQTLASNIPLSVSELAIGGETVKRLSGVAEGVQVGHILDQLLDFVLEHPEKNNRQDLALFVQKMGRI